MALDDLLKGLGSFKEGLQSLAQGMAVNDARDQLSQINAQVQKESEKQMMAQQVGQDLALRLTKAGADANQIAGATQGILPSANQQQTMTAQKDMQAAGFEQQTKEKGMDRDLAITLKQMEMDRLGLKDDKKEAQIYTKLSDTFRKENKDLVGNWEKVSSLNSVLKSTPDRVGVEMAKTGLLKFAGEDRVSDADVARAQRDPSLRAGIARRLKLEMTGEALADDRKFYQAILTHAEGLMKNKLSEKAKGYSKGSATLSGVDPDKLEKGLRQQLSLQEDAPMKLGPPVESGRRFSPKLNQTQITFSDGTTRVVPGKQLRGQ